MADLLNDVQRGCCRPSPDGRSVVGQKILLDLVAVGLEQHRGAAQLADLLLGALDHAVTLAGLLVKHLPAGGHLEALLGGGLGLELGHLALLCGSSRGRRPGWPDFARWSVLIEHFAVATAALSAGRRKGGVMAEPAAKYNRHPNSSGEWGLAAGLAAARWARRNRRPGLIWAPTPSPPGGLRSAAPARPWRAWTCRP